MASRILRGKLSALTCFPANYKAAPRPRAIGCSLAHRLMRRRRPSRNSTPPISINAARSSSESRACASSIQRARSAMASSIPLPLNCSSRASALFWKRRMVRGIGAVIAHCTPAAPARQGFSRNAQPAIGRRWTPDACISSAPRGRVIDTKTSRCSNGPRNRSSPSRKSLAS